ncbi:MAG: hypothetical protein EXS51_04420 [Candidatus Taylorbacteria bacterium]|nr:hypothetical protein [Candidatus Taylorbacteria bacterium]
MLPMGIDVGTTLVKCAWITDDGEPHFATVETDGELAELIGKLKALGATTAYRIGIGHRPLLDQQLTLMPIPGDPITAEMHTQAIGTQQLMVICGKIPPKSFVVASIGTGTSYVAIDGDRVESLPYGRPIGGGYLIGLGRALGLGETFKEIDACALSGQPLDIFVRDLVPPEAIDPKDPNVIIAHFARADRASSKADLAASLFHCVAATIAQDAVMLAPRTKDVAFIGTTVAKSTVLQTFLKHYAAVYGFTPHLLGGCAGYAGALGALR